MTAPTTTELDEYAQALIPRLWALSELAPPQPAPPPTPSAQRWRLKREIRELEGEFRELHAHATEILAELIEARSELARLEGRQ